MRTQATISSFFLVFTLYLVYGWAIVPLVLPNPGGSSADSLNIAIGNSNDTTREEIEHLLVLFPQDGWERNPSEAIHMLRSEQTIVLFGKDEIDGKRIRLEPCTIVLLPNAKDDPGGESADNSLPRAVVLRTPKYAEIVFDQDFDISKISLPKIVSGRFFGQVTIESHAAFGNGHNPGKENDFSLTTEDIEITESPGLTRIETLKDVEFTFGAHSGAGAGLALDIALSDLTQPQSEKVLNNVRFQRLRSLHLAFPGASIDATCRGPFVFALNSAEQGWTARFYQKVEMQRNNSNNTSDTLTADDVYLTLKPANGGSIANKPMRLDNVEPVKFVARGKPGQSGQPPQPARLSVKQGSDVTLVGDEIFFDLHENFLSLSSWQGAGASPFVQMIIADQYTIQSEHCVQYTLGQNGAFGKFASEGAGNLTGKTGEGTSAKEIYLAWNKMQMETHPLLQDQIVMTLSKGVTARMPGLGTMTAEELQLFCDAMPSKQPSKQPAAKLPGTGLPGTGLSGTGGQKSSNFLLDQAIVKGKDGETVRFETTAGVCKVKQLQILFTNVIDGKAVHSRWMPPTLKETPPVAPEIAMASAVTTYPIRQVQHLEPLAPIQPIQPVQPILTMQPMQPMQPIPLYQPSASSPAPVYGTNILSNPHPVQTSTPMKSAPGKGTLETQNLLGMKSSPNSGKFDMTGDLMRMRVLLQNGQSSAENIDFEGNVCLKESIVSNVPGGAIEITGDTVRIWNPADQTTQINISGHTTGKEAVFKGKGVEFRTKELNISRPDNMFWSDTAGQLVVNTAQLQAQGLPSANLATNSAAHSGEKLTVEWNKKMCCNGKVLQFEGQAGKNSNRVLTKYQTYSMWCDFMEIELNRQVMFFDDQSNMEVKAAAIRCVDDVHIQSLQRDAQGKQKSINRAFIARLHYNVENDYFSAVGPGELSSMFLGTGQGFDKANVAATPGKETLNYLAVWFQEEMQGILRDNNKKVDFKGHVDAAYYPAAGWEDTIDHANFRAARKTGYTLECERLQIDEMPNPLNLSQSFMELTASNGAILDGSGIFGKAQSIKYSQAKSMIYCDGNVDLRTATQGQQAKAKSIHYNIETGRIDFQAQGLSVGQ